MINIVKKRASNKAHLERKRRKAGIPVRPTRRIDKISGPIVCTKCNQVLPISHFGITTKRGYLTYQSRCKVCITKEQRIRVSKNRELYNARSRAYSKAHPEAMRARNHKRRAMLRNAEGNFTVQEWISTCDKYNNKCAICGCNKKMTVDHIIPLTKGGSNYINNIQPLCHSCNARKGNRIVPKEGLLDD